MPISISLRIECGYSSHQALRKAGIGNRAMTIQPIDALGVLFDRKKRLAGLDLGTKTIGVAISDVEWRIATPHTVIRRTKFKEDVAKLLGILAHYDVAALVLGLPLNMDGSSGPRVQATHAFSRSIAPFVACPIATIDERLTTAEAERAMIAADRSRKKRAESIDAAAAAIILQTALDRLDFLRRTDSAEL
jgi:putative holliday junction resolvase